ncbi:hypothetical protein [Actinoalloteichus hymeniacidonis]|uniref:Uncharacterized protein n=1 Tax=Actinoalloteichus hymeniacidonis TaxID=340345 RepID=A0AAC9HU44_9PSEU|nr:hypothetical protein [Actinoalloteichus hymeniacidonis]AOS65440.1 hypothetical protein TL08_23300 [Actinoalloteichus hymeniacidonis]MBB5906473.1 hypothetical protein [Actinoalloteichus hymeniacidonis]
MSYSAEQDPIELVRGLLAEVAEQTGFPLASWAHEEHGVHVMIDVEAPNEEATSLGMWVLGAIVLVFLDIEQPVEFDLRSTEEQARFVGLLTAVVLGTVELEETVERSAVRPNSIRWPGGSAELVGDRPVISRQLLPRFLLRRAEPEQRVRKLAPWSPA